MRQARSRSRHGDWNAQEEFFTKENAGAQHDASPALEEARLLSPDRLEQLARELQLVNPDPKRVLTLNPKADSALALNVTQ